MMAWATIGTRIASYINEPKGKKKHRTLRLCLFVFLESFWSFQKPKKLLKAKSKKLVKLFWFMRVVQLLKSLKASSLKIAKSSTNRV
jgi:hypothetical protein